MTSTTLARPTAPLAPGGLPGLGHGLRMRRGGLLAFLESLSAHGEVVRIGLGPHPAFVVTTPQLVRQVLVGEARSFHKGRLFDKARPFLGNGVMLSDGDFHLRQRRLVQPAFHRQRIEGYVRIMAEGAAATADSWRAGRPVDVPAEMYDLVIAVLGRTLFSTELGGWAALEAQRSMPVIQEVIARRTVSPLTFLERLPTPGNRRFDQAIHRLRGVLDRVVAEARADRTDRGDLLSMLIAARDAETGEAMPDEQLRDDLVNILAAGMESTTHSLAWALHLLGAHPEHQLRVREEIDQVLAGRAPAVADVPRLHHLGNVVKETLRLYPPAGLFMRRAIAPVELSGIPFPTGTEVIVSPYLMHRHPGLFPNPDRFDPDRWDRPETADLPRGAYLPFGMGNRLCLGDTFAMTEIPVVLATLLARWQLTPSPGCDVRPVPAVTISPSPFTMLPHART
ncbi:cytochrome P450 [Kitasatospora sp. NPDC049285]|uniref:cytochrome P450 n=1 Tax=Kitasatospora sp. NPDC049285 TaxID=3157096 RepID=UPI0034167BC4